MDRREFLAASAGLMGTAIVPAEALAAAPASPALRTLRHLRMTCSFPPSPAGTFDRASGLAARLQTLLGGAYRIELTTSATGSIAAFAGETADIVFASEAANTEHLPDLAPMTGLPGHLAPCPADVRQWLTGLGGQLWHQMHGTTGIEPLYAGPEGTAPSLWSRRPIETFSGLKVASAAGLRAELLKGLGASITALQPGDFVDAVAGGAVDAVEIPSIADAFALGIGRSAPFCLQGALAEHTGSLALSFAPALWTSFNTQTRAALRTLADEFNHNLSVRSAADETALRAVMRTAYGTTFSAPTRHAARTIHRLSEAVVADFVSAQSKSIIVKGATVALPLVKRKTDSNSTHCMNVV